MRNPRRYWVSERVGAGAKIAGSVEWGSRKAVPDRVLGTTQPGTSNPRYHRRPVLRTILAHPLDTHTAPRRPGGA